jgi:GH43 family beta-xylosidase
MSWQNRPVVHVAEPRVGPERDNHGVRRSVVGASPRYPLTFTNPLYKGADPFVVRHDGRYFMIQAGPGGRLEVWRSRTLTDRGERKVVWTPPRTGWNRAQVWAPELHYLRGRWYIYYAASNGRNATHRMGVLESTTDDPQGPYVDRGTLYTGDDVLAGRHNRWAIDGTVLQLGGRLYFLWSGWADERDVQHLYVARMSDPCTIASNRVQLCPNDCHPWERVGETHHERGLNEGPQVLVRNGKVFLIYSCSGSWQPTYKLGLLYMDAAADPMDARSWRKLDRPVFDSTPDVFGVGHCCFTTSPDGTEDWILYHSKRFRWDCWDRVVRAQPFSWRDDGFPDFGRPVPSGMPIAAPSGDAPTTPSRLSEAA